MYQGCKQTKIILLHLKCCPFAARDQECHVQECNQARKLLRHYRHCRDARISYARRRDERRNREQNHKVNQNESSMAKPISSKCREKVASSLSNQVSNSSTNAANTSLNEAEPPSCLICSMVTRHVRNVLEQGPSHAPVPLLENNRCIPVAPPPPKRSDSALFMPPPPPRRPRSTSVPSMNEAKSSSSKEFDGQATAVLAAMSSSIKPASLFRQRSSSDGMLCTLANKMPCDTIFEDCNSER